MAIIDYTPPPTVREFILDYQPGGEGLGKGVFYDWIVGPVGSGKTTGLFFKLIYMASLQAPSPDGIRRTRAVIVRNTMPQLKDTTLVSWGYWFRDGRDGTWNATDKNFTLRVNDIECVVMFRPLDTEQDIARVLSLEINFAIIDEFVQIPRKIVDALSARLGRFKLPDGTKPTNWGMWGSSNPSTEDNWWFDYLHRSSANPGEDLPPNGRYFLQPSGLSDKAENLENLPGGRSYYVNQCQGKSDVWVNQFVHAEWGFSVSGKAVIQSFKAELHISAKPLLFNSYLPLVIGLDPGLGGSALIFGQEDLHGRLLIFGELVQMGMGSERIITERLKPYLRRKFPDAQDIIIASDPAGNNRGASDEKEIIRPFKRAFNVSCETNNRLPLRTDAIEHFTTRLTPAGPALQIDGAQCPVLIRALKGGWRWEIDQKRDINKSATPEKNQFSHPGDACGYLARYFHRKTAREKLYAPEPGDKPRFARAQAYQNQYHFR